MGSVVVLLREEIDLKYLLSTSDISYLLRESLSIQNKSRDRGSPCLMPLDYENYSMGDPLTRIDILVKAKRSPIQPRKIPSKLKHFIIPKIKSQRIVSKALQLSILRAILSSPLGSYIALNHSKAPSYVLINIMQSISIRVEQVI